jgi:shikimate dehydrogenase
MDAQHIYGSTRLVGLLGNPLGHSLSPLIHNHAFARLNLPYAYVPLPVSHEMLHSVLHTLRACNFAGANVTIPHKQHVVPYCDYLSPLSAITGAVNTLYFRNNLLCGTTTDAAGFFRALETMNRSVQEERVVILGNGGLARTLAFAYALSRFPPQLTILGRSVDKVKLLADEVARVTGFLPRCAVASQPEGMDAIRSCTLLVNCTSAGMAPHTDAVPIDVTLLHSGITVFDTIYNPAQTKLLAAAHSEGCPTQNGLRMLLYQGLASCTYWTGIEVDESLFSLDELQAHTVAEANKDIREKQS